LERYHQGVHHCSQGGRSQWCVKGNY
jgi:hypothetical protein